MFYFIDADIACEEMICDILIKSKGYWGYSQEQLDRWRSGLSFTAEYFSNNTVKLILHGSEIIGFFALVQDDVSELDHFWLLPKFIGKGYGSAIFDHVVSECKKFGITDFYITSDPDAEGFYLKKGAVRISKIYSEHQKRMLPRLRCSVIVPT